MKVELDRYIVSGRCGIHHNSLRKYCLILGIVPKTKKNRHIYTLKDIADLKRYIKIMNKEYRKEAANHVRKRKKNAIDRSLGKMVPAESPIGPAQDHNPLTTRKGNRK